MEKPQHTHADYIYIYMMMNYLMCVGYRQKGINNIMHMSR
jgi:hypothetical protein